MDRSRQCSSATGAGSRKLLPKRYFSSLRVSGFVRFVPEDCAEVGSVSSAFMKCRSVFQLKSSCGWQSGRELLHDDAGGPCSLPVIVLDEAQHLSDVFLADLSGFLNFAFDTRSPAALWLVGLPRLAARLRMQLHAPLATRIAAQVHLAPLEREDFKALVEHGIKAAGSREKLLTDSALELLFRISRGIPRIASRLLRAGLKQAHARNQNVVDDVALRAAVESLTLVEEVKS